MTGPIERPWWRGSGWGLAFGSFGLAVAAVAALALGADDTRLLRLGIVAALWAALLGAFAAARMRREVRSTADQVEELRTVYQSELEREIAARQEHEQTMERELRLQVEQSRQEDIAALRAEMQLLRDTLQHLLGGDVLVERERVALRESTRLRPLPDHSRTVPSAELLARSPRNIPAADWPVTGIEPEAPPSVRRAPVPADPPAELATADLRHDPLESFTDAWNGINGSSWAAEPVRTAVPTDPLLSRRAEPELNRDDLVSSDRSWSPAVSWTPAGGIPAVSSTGTGRNRRYLSEPDRAQPKPESGGGRQAQTAVRNGKHDWRNESDRTSNASPIPDPEVGAPHGARSVQDLIAAYGQSSAPRHRRRRKDD